ncbi:MAG: hypothetical protein Q7T82_11390 [Armatimonadota bacterium]|nr:hypothetical protein [Armatimonadota bacterium]
MKSDVIGFAKPVGMTLDDWAAVCNHAAWRVSADTAARAVKT